MSQTSTRTPTDAALRLAAEVRGSVRQRSVDLDAALSRYDEIQADPGASPEEKGEAAAILMRVVSRTDLQHHARKADAFGDFAAATKGRDEAA